MKLKTFLYKVPLLGPLVYRLRDSLAEWTIYLADRQIRLLVPAEYVKQYMRDDRQGQFTGVDKLGRYEFAFAQRFRECLTPETVLIDVGASYGLYSVFAAQMIQPRHIFSFEPEPFSRWVLGRNRSKYCNDKFQIDGRFVAEGSAQHEIALDDYCRKQDIRPSLIKMDIEGFEFHAVRGMSYLCQEVRPVILMEFHHRKMREKLGVEPMQLLEQLRRWGYILRFNGHHWYTAQHAGEVDEGWHEDLPNEINCALWANPA